MNALGYSTTTRMRHSDIRVSWTFSNHNGTGKLLDDFYVKCIKWICFEFTDAELLVLVGVDGDKFHDDDDDNVISTFNRKKNMNGVGWWEATYKSIYLPTLSILHFKRKRFHKSHLILIMIWFDMEKDANIANRYTQSRKLQWFDHKWVNT